MIEKKIFGYFNGKAVYIYTMKNNKNTEVSCISYGAALAKIIVPNNKGSFSNILLGFDNLDDYLKDDKMYLGKAIGRVGGRIANGSFEINGKIYNVPKNEGENTLHGGGHGFNSFIWNSETEELKGESSVIFSKTITEEEDGFPGTLDVKIKYTLNDNNDLITTFSGLSDKDTLFNPTVHSYFNLNGDLSKKLYHHNFKVNADKYAETGSNVLPTGKLVSTTGTPFDLLHSKDLIQAIDDVKNKLKLDGFDHPFNINDSKAASLESTQTGIHMDVSSNRNALVVYTLNSIDGQWTVNGKKIEPQMGIALEPQTLPDAIHHEGFGDIILSANKLKEYKMKYHFSLL